MPNHSAGAGQARLTHIDELWIQVFSANVLLIGALKIWSFQQILDAINWIADGTRIQSHEAQTALIARLRLRTRQIKRRGPIRGKCLSRSLALYGVLRRYGIHSTIQIGVRRDTSDFAAHAWVEIDSQPVNAGPKVRMRYAVFERSFGDSR